MNLDNKAITKSPSRRSSPNNNINNNKTDSEPLYPEDHNLTLEDHLNERKENFDKNEGLLRPNILNECDININADDDVKSVHSNIHQDDYINNYKEKSNHKNVSNFSPEKRNYKNSYTLNHHRRSNEKLSTN